MSQPPVLELKNLRTSFTGEDGKSYPAVNDVSLRLERGRILGLVGESGSGKSVTGFSIMGLIDPPGQVEKGEIRFMGDDLRTYTAKQMRALQGNRLAMIFQDPMMTLNPVLRIDLQMIEAIRAHESISKAKARDRAVTTLGLMGIPSPEERIRQYPHQMSGGMRQRVAIAIAMLHQPDLIIADEPTTALDVTIQAQILSEVQKRVREQGTSLIWITHDLSVVAGLADDIAVMYAGRIVEFGAVDAVLDHPAHPYTEGLIASLPANNQRGERLYQIPGMTPSLKDIPEGCAFKARCPFAQELCDTPPPMRPWRRGVQVRCHFPRNAEVSDV
ncbi:ABC transporter ATP-binding protein [Paenalcaligenes niemegkensis]|uniref:ABC transporter ATP-binding protein n=1 Tax=Paenalcaligenes niemegkensis TaxID=2895469 RepID=UPI001EE97ED8|nr:ABC transporter ATP-binding protein [Paenalcaligenes niemegkensis]MCQ9617179.1 ABC transporter ATP-binding protein [Paenalcaligenes niemegkensis]